MSNSKLELRFLTLWSELASGTNFSVIREFRAIEGRKFSFDFYIPEASLLVEIHGGAYSGGRHTTGVGLSADSEKSRLAQMQGYQVFAYTGPQVTKSNVQELVDYCIKRAKLQKRKRKPQTTQKESYNNGANKSKAIRRKRAAKATIDTSTSV